MTTPDRREFLRKLAKTAAYTAPVVYTLAAPIDLVGQGSSSQHKKQQPAAAYDTQSPNTQPGGQAPWDAPPP